MLRALKAVDLYRKAATDFQNPTALGGTLSVISYLMIIFLLSSEIFSYFLSSPVPTLVIEPYLNEDYMLLSVNISFFNSPCNSLAVFLTDSSHEHYKFYSLNKSILSAQRTILSTVISVEIDDIVEGCGDCYGANTYAGQCCNSCADVMESYSRKMWKPPQFSHIDQCKKFIIEGIEGQGCMLTGDLKVKKMPSSLHFKNTFDLDRHSMYRYNGHHQVNSLVFKDPLAEFKEIRGPMDGNLVERGYSSSYYLKLVPAVTRDGRYYQASFNYLTMDRVTNPEVVVTYDIEPISTVYKDKQTFTQFLVSICAIIGGWYALTLLIARLIIK